ncbi:MAG TPA: DMT family transporter [Candidatus Lachnoclostridium stercoripullorum]|uniref:DMT family transporter n=1 Tax=Candidatus Lachnoclostridium stercoripullorum TaxID=2838635 RepID=A0A9D2AVS3_9FIRM|nr:DMT family transporter [Candidatus Lachnoclostridium stercoripullorum]
MNTHASARLKLTASMVIFGTLGIFTRNIAVSSGELALYRAILAAGLILVYLAAGRKPIPFKKIRRELPLLLLSGMAMGVNWVLLFSAYRFTTISMATLSYYFAPVIVILACPILFHERMTAKEILCFVMSTAGLVLIIGAGGAGNGTDLIGVLFGLGAAAFYAAVILMNKFIRQVTGIHRTLIQFAGAILILLPYVGLTGGFHLEVLDGTGWVCLLVVGLVHTGVTYCMYFSALKDLSGQETAVLSYMDPLVATLISVLVLGEPMALTQALGGAMILGFTLWNELPSKK